MQVAADAVVVLTGLPIAGGLVIAGLGSDRPAEIAAGVLLALLLGTPSLALALRARLARSAMTCTRNGPPGEPDGPCDQV